MKAGIRRQWWLIAAAMVPFPSVLFAQQTVFYDDYPSAASLSNPQLTLSGTTDELAWATGIDDGIAGPYDGGGVIYSYDRNAATDSSPYAYMTYAINAPAGYVFDAPSATITGTTYNSTYTIILSSSYNGVAWENSVNCDTNDYSTDIAATTNEAGNSNYNNLPTLYYQIAMPTYNDGTTGGDLQLGILDNITIQATLVQVSSNPEWSVSSSGDWNVASNWSTGAVPNGIGSEADLFSAITSNETVYTNTAVTLGTLNFNNANEYVVTGAGSLFFQALSGENAQVIVQNGTQEINLPTTLASNTVFNVSAGANLLIANPLTIDSGVSLTQTGSGTVTYQSIVNVETNASVMFANSTHAHELNLAANSTATVSAPTLEVDSLSNLGTLNLQNNTVIINYGSGSDPILAIAAEIKSGYAGGAWDGTGIISSNAQDNSSYGIGYADAADPGNPAGLASGQIEIMYTLLGDANLDGKVNGADFILMAANFNDAVAAGWDEGDFNYDGVVNGNDFVLLADNFNDFASQSAVSTADLAALDAFATSNGISLNVPEPGSIALLGVGILGGLRRRKRSF